MFDSLSVFEISEENIVQEKRRKSIGGVSIKQQGNQVQQDIEESTSEESFTEMAADQILTLLGDLACYQEEIEDCLHTDIRNFRSVEEFDELRKDVKVLKANLQKSITKLKYLKKDEDLSVYSSLVDEGKKLMALIDSSKFDFLNEQSKNHNDQVFSHVNVLIVSLDLAFRRLNEKFTVNWAHIEDGELLLLGDNLSSVREEFNNLNKLYLEFIEKCPVNYPDRENGFARFKIDITDTEEKKTLYESTIRREMHQRELTRDKIQDVKNEIKLASFQGYGSTLDFYNFKSQFLNKYRRYTSRDLVDILKNTYLKGEAHNTVKELNTLDGIWERLKNEFGNPSRMLKTKLTEIIAVGPLHRIKGITEKSEAVLKVINLLSDVFKLAEDHSLHLDLYCKNEKVLGQMLKQLPRLWLHDWQILKKAKKAENERKIIGAPAWTEDQLNWEMFKSFLEEQLINLKDEEAIEDSLKDVLISEDKGSKGNPVKGSHLSDCSSKDNVFDNDYYEYEDFGNEKLCHSFDKKTREVTCKLCKLTHHKHYWDCEVFMKMKHGERFELFINPRKNTNPKPHIGKLLGECAACLMPNEKFGHQCHDRENVKKWLCPEAHQRPVHILCCRHHTNSNQHIWEQFHFNTRTGFLQEDELVPAWKREMKWSNFCINTSISYLPPAFLGKDNKSTFEESIADVPVLEKPIRGEGLFLFQKVVVDHDVYNVFFDSGCGDFCIRKSEADRLGKRATQLQQGTFEMTGVGNVKTEVKHGLYEVRLPLANGNEALFGGLCMDELTSKFCEYNISTLYNELAEDYEKCGGKKESLPSLSSTAICGGETDIMIGILYNRYQPRMVHELESGLAIYRSSFLGIDGSTAVIGGPHPLIAEIEQEYSRRNKSFARNDLKNYFSQQLKLYLDGYDINPDSRFTLKRYMHEEKGHYLTKSYKKFLECENAGTALDYRCVKCRNCKDCKCGPQTEEVSRKEEAEQHIIEQSVKFNTEEGHVECELPLLQDPKVLGKNSKNAHRIYNRWVSKINKNPKDLISVVRSEHKLQTKGHVEFLKNLTKEQQKIIIGSPYRYTLPWRPVWNENSLTTPCRITFDASDKTDSGMSLNDILPKGINQINSLLEIVINWRNGKFAMASDIEQMYNGIKLAEKHWPLQMYLWNDDLVEGVTPELKIIKTVTYGVRSSSNQAITGVRRVAEHSQEEYPEVHKVLTKEIYVDDILPKGKDSLQECYTLADQLNIVVKRGGLKLKNFAFTSVIPDSSISSDNIIVDIAGMKWETVADELGLNITLLNFGKKYRGKKPNSPESFQVPKKLSRRICTSVVGEIWDLVGVILPITARLKLDLHELVIRKLDWDDEIPDELRKVWIDNFEMINMIKDIRFTRATVPSDAVNLKMETIEAGDASSSVICAAVYVRFKRACGEYSCELVVGKSKLVPSGMSVPRAELYAAEINSSLGQMVKRAFGDNLTKSFKITDSKVALHWINSWEKPLKLWTRNRVNEILRFSDVKDWYWVPSEEMPCDIGTRRNATINDIGNGSEWKQGLNWMCKDVSNFPLRTLKEVKLAVLDKVSYDKEITVESKMFTAQRKCREMLISERIGDRLKFSNYILQPNKYRFKNTVRILGIVFHFLFKASRNLKRKIFAPKNEEEIQYKFKHFPAVSVNKDTEYSKDAYDRMSGLLFHKQKIVICPNLKAMPKKSKLPVVTLSKLEIDLALQYLYQKATKEIEEFGRHTKAFKNSMLINGIRYWTGRLLPSQQFTYTELHPMSSVMADLCGTVFCVPVVDKFSPIAWSLIHEIHWYHPVGKHSGVATTARMSKEYAYIDGVKEIADSFRKLCAKCRWIRKRTVEVEFGPLSDFQLKLAPAFYITQVDLMGPFKAYQINVRATIKIWFAVFVCVATSTVEIQVMEFYSSGSFISAFIRFASHNGYPKVLLPDQGKNVECALGNMEIDWIDVKGQLHKSYGVDLETCGVGGHHQHGKVERKIRQIKETFLKTLHNERISVLQWQTVADEAANCINNLPIGTGSSRNVNLEIDDLDIITPNRLRLGRNNERCPLGPAYISNDPFKFMDINRRIFECWWEHWLTSAAPQLIEKPVNWKGDENLKEGNIVLFRKCEGAVGAGTYQFGIVQTVCPSNDGIVRNVVVKYRNHDEGVDRNTKRAVKSLILIHSVEELDIMKAMADASEYVDELINKDPK